MMIDRNIPELRITTSRECTIRVSFGADATYDLVIVLGGNCPVDDATPEGADIHGCSFRLGGLDDTIGDKTRETRVYRAFNADELEWLAKGICEAARRLRQMDRASAKRVKAKASPAGTGVAQ